MQLDPFHLHRRLPLGERPAFRDRLDDRARGVPRRTLVFRELQRVARGRELHRGSHQARLRESQAEHLGRLLVLHEKTAVSADLRRAVGGRGTLLVGHASAGATEPRVTNAAPRRVGIHDRLAHLTERLLPLTERPGTARRSVLGRVPLVGVLAVLELIRDVLSLTLP